MRVDQDEHPEDKPISAEGNPLPFFQHADPSTVDNKDIPANNLWEEILNRLMKSTPGWSTDGVLRPEEALTSDGEGTRGLVRFVSYVVRGQWVNAVLFEGKLSPPVSKLRERLVFITCMYAMQHRLTLSF